MSVSSLRSHSQASNHRPINRWQLLPAPLFWGLQIRWNLPHSTSPSSKQLINQKLLISSKYQQSIDNLLYLKQSPTPPFSATEYICHTFALCATLQHNLWLLSYPVYPCPAALLQICFAFSSKIPPSALKFVITIKSIDKHCHCLSYCIKQTLSVTSLHIFQPISV